MKIHQAKLELEIMTTLGEGPLWDATNSRLYFVDIIEKKLHSFDPIERRLKNWSFDSYTSAVALYKKDKLVVTSGSKIVELNLDLKLLLWWIKSSLQFDRESHRQLVYFAP